MHMAQKHIVNCSTSPQHVVFIIGDFWGAKRDFQSWSDEEADTPA